MVAEAGSIRAAARRLGLAQPTVTEHVRRLESTLGFPVFERIGRRVVLTEPGRQLLPRAQRAVRAIDEVAEGIGEEVAAGAGRLTIGAIPTMSPYLLPPVLAKLRDEYPECEIVVHEELTEELLDRLDDSSIEAAVLSPPVSHPRIECETLGAERLLIVASADSELDMSAGVSLGELRRHPRISLSDMHCLGTQIEHFCARRELGGQLTCHARQLDTVFEFVRLGLGVSLVPSMAVRNRPADGLRYARLRRDAPKRDIGIATRIGRTRSVLADRFAALLELEVRTLAE
jgi:LysR family hydrogen peroxide-inducible transcriptional activator